MFAQTFSAKKLGTLFFGAMLALMLLAPGVSAVDLNSKNNLCTGANLTFKSQGCNVDADGNPVAGTDTAESKVSGIVTDAINLISIIVGILAVIMIIYAGFKFVTSAGNPETTKSARNTILYAIIGLVIVAFAQFIVKFVLSKIT